MSNQRELESLNQLELDVEELERRIEMHSFLHPLDVICYSHTENPPPPPPPPPWSWGPIAL